MGVNPADRIQTLASRLFEGRGEDLLRFLRRRLGSSVEARDLAQEAYLRFIRLGDPDRIENPEAYLFRIASNLLWEHKLRERTASDAAPLEEALTVEQTPVEFAIASQTGERLKSVLNIIPPLPRAMLLLHLRDELTCAQIAAQSGISASMVKKHINNALALCRKRLKDHE